MLVAGRQRELAAALSAADVLVLPTLTDAPPRLDEERQPVGLTTLTIPFNVLGWPAVSVPAHAARGGVIPPSVQLIGPLGSEELLLGLAAQLPSQRPT